MVSAVLLLPAILHLLLPWVLRWLVQIRAHWFSRRNYRTVSLVYPATTIALAVPAVVVFLLIGAQAPSRGQHLWITELSIGAAMGLIFPLLLGILSHRSTGIRWNTETRRRAVTSGLTGAAEEVIWRLAAISGLFALGATSEMAVVLTVSVGFLILHIPLYGVRRLPYLATFTVLLALLFIFLGPLACIAAHLVHNVYLALTGKMGLRQLHRRKDPPRTISSAQW